LAKKLENKKRFLVYIFIDYNRLMKKVKVGELVVTDADGELVLDSVGGTMGYHEGRPSRRKFKLIVKDFVEAELEDIGEEADVSLDDIVLAGYDEIKEILWKTRNDIFPKLQDLR
jgi:hypothetical protein